MPPDIGPLVVLVPLLAALAAALAVVTRRLGRRERPPVWALRAVKGACLVSWLGSLGALTGIGLVLLGPLLGWFRF